MTRPAAAAASAPGSEPDEAPGPSILAKQLAGNGRGPGNLKVGRGPRVPWLGPRLEACGSIPAIVLSFQVLVGPAGAGAASAAASLAAGCATESVGSPAQRSFKFKLLIIESSVGCITSCSESSRRPPSTRHFKFG